MSATNQPARRGFLALFGGAIAAPAATALPATAATTALVPTESPDLLTLGEHVVTLGDALSAAIDQLKAAKEIYERTRPALPPELIALPRDARTNKADERSPLGGGKSQVIYVSRGIRAEIILYDISRHTKEGKRLRRIARIAKAYEDADLAAYTAADVDRLEYSVSACALPCLKAIQSLCELEPTTMTGMVIVARAMALLPATLSAMGYFPTTALEGKLGNKLAAALIRCNGTEAHNDRDL